MNTLKMHLVTSVLSFVLLVLAGTNAFLQTIVLSGEEKGLNLNLNGYHGSFEIDMGIGLDITNEKCASGIQNEHCFGVKGSDAKLTIKDLETGVKTVTCSQVTWHNPDSKTEDCITLGTAFWYGGSEMLYQHWPIQNISYERTPYVTGDSAHDPLGGINDNIWYNSDGYMLFVDRNSPLFVRFNRTGDNKFCLSASYDEYPFSGAGDIFRKNKELKYTYCTADNIKESFQFAIGRWIDIPTGVIDPDVVAKPIWSTWAQFKRNISGTIVENFANKIKNNGFTGSHFEIDDLWEPCYGEMEFDTKTFPDIAQTVRKIKALGFNVSLWIHPYVNTDCPSFSNATIQQYLIKNQSGQPVVCEWWNGKGGYLDSTNPEATEHLVSKLLKLKASSGIDTFKFDSGEVDYIEDGFVFSDPTVMATPNNFTRLYVTMASRLGNAVEVRVGYNTQNLPIFVRMLDKDSTWGYNNGLQTLIPSALHMSTIGFPYILPDMIGGNSYGGEGQGLPEKELFIRWLQVNVFMPSLQFSIAPWDYDQQVVNISKAMVKLHEDHAQLINSLADEATRTGNPIVRPLWWIAPKDENALLAEQQFLLGDDLLVAPIVEKGTVNRDIYIPEGTWEDKINEGIKHIGPMWLKNYQALIHQVPYFTRVKDKKFQSSDAVRAKKDFRFFLFFPLAHLYYDLMVR